MENQSIFNTYFSPIVKDYLKGDEKLLPFYAYPLRIDAFGKAIANRRFSPEAGNVWWRC